MHISKLSAPNLANTSYVVHNVINVGFLIKIVLHGPGWPLESFWVEFGLQAVPHVEKQSSLQ